MVLPNFFRLPCFLTFFRLQFSCVYLCADLRITVILQLKSLLEACVNACVRIRDQIIWGDKIVYYRSPAAQKPIEKFYAQPVKQNADPTALEKIKLPWNKRQTKYKKLFAKV